MFRVIQTKDRFGKVVNIDGQLAGDYVHAAEDYCARAPSSGTPVSLFLRELSAIDEAGWNLLRRLAEQGVRLLASGVYTSQLVRSLQRAGTVPWPVGSVGDGRHPA